MLNNYFALQAMVDDNNHPLPQTLPPQHQLLPSINMSVQDVTDVLENLDISKACGPDLISPRLLKEGSSILARPFTYIFNNSLEQGIFPSPWKDSNIMPIHKKDDKSMPSNFRPVSLLSQESKVMERCIHKHFIIILWRIIS